MDEKIQICPTCFKDKCNHKSEKFGCDELMVYPLQRLNELGYKTMFCCSGHMSRPYGITDDVKTYIDDEFVMISQTYIMFKEMYHFKSLPEQFYLVYNEFNKTWSIEYRAPAICGDFKERYEHIITANASLFNWLQKLEPCDSEYKVVKR